MSLRRARMEWLLKRLPRERDNHNGRKHDLEADVFWLMLCVKLKTCLACGYTLPEGAVPYDSMAKHWKDESLRV